MKVQHVEQSGLEGPRTANGSVVSVECLLQRRQRELVISVYPNTHFCFSLIYLVVGCEIIFLLLFFTVFSARFPFKMSSDDVLSPLLSGAGIVAHSMAVATKDGALLKLLGCSFPVCFTAMHSN